MTDPDQHIFEPRGAFGVAAPAQATGVNEIILAALLDLVQDMRADRDRLLKQLIAGATSAPTGQQRADQQQAADAEREKAKEKLASLRSAKLVVEHKLKRKTEECDRAIAEVHEWRERATACEDRAREAGDDSARHEEEIRSLKKQIVVDTNELKDAYREIARLEEQAAEAREAPATPLAGASLDAVRRHVDSAIQNFDDPDKSLRALKRAQAALTSEMTTETGKED